MIEIQNRIFNKLQLGVLKKDIQGYAFMQMIREAWLKMF